MTETPQRRHYMDTLKRKGKLFNQPTKKSAFTKSGKIFRNDLLDTDYTRQDMGTVRKTRGV